MVKKIVIGLLGLVVIVLAGAGAGLVWAGSAAQAKLDKKYAVEAADVPVPWPLTDDEVAALREDKPVTSGEEEDAAPEGEPAAEAAPPSDEELKKVAMERAVARGEHIVSSRAGCTHCHGEDFGGGIIFDNPAMGRWEAPNITKGKGSVVADYTPRDWVRILRHGLNKDGTAASMPSIDFSNLSDQELSDIIAYVTSRPPVDREGQPSAFGPVMKMLVATGEIPISADLIDHEAARPKTPPPPAADPKYGEHLAGVCMGCHGQGFTGGKVPGGDPAWPAAANLTPHESGLNGWTVDDFKTALKTGKSKDGHALDKVAMPWPALKNMKDVEMEALYAYFASLPPKPAGNR